MYALSDTATEDSIFFVCATVAYIAYRISRVFIAKHGGKDDDELI